MLTPLVLEYAKVVQQTIHVSRVDYCVRLTHPDFDYIIDGWYDGIIRPTNYTGNDTHFYVLDTYDSGWNPVHSTVFRFTLTCVNAGSQNVTVTLHPSGIGEFIQMAKGQALTMVRDEVYLIGGP